MYHLENLVGKPAMFASIFFGREDAIKEFACNYKKYIDTVWNEFYKKADDDREISTEEKFKAILVNACDMTKTEDEQKNTQRYISQSALDLIFLRANIQAYDEKKISKTRFMEICRESSIISPSIYDPYKDEVESSRAKAAYDKLYIRLRREKDAENAKVSKNEDDNKDIV